MPPWDCCRACSLALAGLSFVMSGKMPLAQSMMYPAKILQPERATALPLCNRHDRQVFTSCCPPGRSSVGAEEGGHVVHTAVAPVGEAAELAATLKAALL